MVRRPMTAIRKREINLYGGWSDVKRDGAKLVSRASTRDLQLARCFIRQPVLVSDASP